MSIVMLAFATMQVNQTQQVRSLGEVLAENDIQKTITSALADDSVCKYILNNPGGRI